MKKIIILVPILVVVSAILVLSYGMPDSSTSSNSVDDGNSDGISGSYDIPDPPTSSNSVDDGNSDGISGSYDISDPPTSSNSVSVEPDTPSSVVESYGISDPSASYNSVSFVVNALEIDSAVIPSDLASANNDFAVDFYKQASEKEDEDDDDNDNIFFSPTSMLVAFSLLYEGANENTANEIKKVFGLESDPIIRHNSTAHLMSSINQDDQYATLDMANALWVADSFEPYDKYLSVSRETYLASVEKVIFGGGDPPAVKIINDWAAENTNNKIPKVISKDAVNDFTAMVITNAIYFKGTWLTQFQEGDTEESDFWTSNTDSVRADLMKQEGKFDYIQSDGVKVLKMPYEGDRLSMLVVLPEDRDGIDSLEESLSSELIKKWQQELYPQEVKVVMPKFTTKTSYDLIPLLKNLGMLDVFNPDGADLKNIGSSAANLFVSAASHDAFVDVNEEGTEAAAVTTIIDQTTSVPPPLPRFIADHPFLFIIQDDESGTILFMGKLSDPTV